MDPDETLREMRAMVQSILAAGDSEPVALELAEKVDALDGWLRRGGFLPQEWVR
jgi:hypothetical protein